MPLLTRLIETEKMTIFLPLSIEYEKKCISRTILIKIAEWSETIVTVTHVETSYMIFQHIALATLVF